MNNRDKDLLEDALRGWKRVAERLRGEPFTIEARIKIEGYIKKLLKIAEESE